MLPLVGLASLLLRSHLDPSWSNPRAHFVLFMIVGATAAGLAYAAGEAAEHRGDARVLLLSLAFLATGAFLMLHAVGTQGVLVTRELSGFSVAIPIGLLIASLFATASAFVDLRPEYPAIVIRLRAALRGALLVAVAVWTCWTVLELPPLSGPASEGGANDLLTLLAAVGAVLYGICAARYLYVYWGQLSLLPASVVTCCVLLAEALVGVALTGERSWHASWWEWHALIVTAYLVVLFAARREWRDERFRLLYLSATRERTQEVSVLFCDLAGFTSYAEELAPAEVASMLSTYYETATPLISRDFRGEVEKFMGDAIMATFNTRGDQPDHAQRAAAAGLALQEAMARLFERRPGMPGLRVGVNTGNAVVREMGGRGYVAYAVVGDMVNLASRLETNAPVGSVLIGEETYHRLPGATVDVLPPLRVKGRGEAVNAFVLRDLPTAAPRTARSLRRRS
jgi:class 3 adenylate cyclase